MSDEKIWIGNDHGGYELKLQIVEHMVKRGFQVHNAGTDSTAIVRYPYYAAQVCEAISSRRCRPGNSDLLHGYRHEHRRKQVRGDPRFFVYQHLYGPGSPGRTTTPTSFAWAVKSQAFLRPSIFLMVRLNTAYEGGRHDISLGLICRAGGQSFEVGSLEPLRSHPHARRSNPHHRADSSGTSGKKLKNPKCVARNFRADAGAGQPFAPAFLLCFVHPDVHQFAVHFQRLDLIARHYVQVTRIEKLNQILRHQC